MGELASFLCYKILYASAQGKKNEVNFFAVLKFIDSCIDKSLLACKCFALLPVCEGYYFSPLFKYELLSFWHFHTMCLIAVHGN